MVLGRRSRGAGSEEIWRSKITAPLAFRIRSLKGWDGDRAQVVKSHFSPVAVSLVSKVFRAQGQVGKLPDRSSLLLLLGFDDGRFSPAKRQGNGTVALQPQNPAIESDVDLAVVIEIQPFGYLVGAVFQVPNPQLDVVQGLAQVESGDFQSVGLGLGDQSGYLPPGIFPAQRVSRVNLLVCMSNSAQTSPLGCPVWNKDAGRAWFSLGNENPVLFQMLEQRCLVVEQVVLSSGRLVSILTRQ